jgi:hypothetical protein
MSDMKTYKVAVDGVLAGQEFFNETAALNFAREKMLEDYAEPDGSAIVYVAVKALTKTSEIKVTECPQ